MSTERDQALPTRLLKAKLEALREGTSAEEVLAADPLGIVHRFAAPRDQEVVGLIASSLAFGNVVVIRRSIEACLERLSTSPSRATQLSLRTLKKRLSGFRHRVYTGDDLALVLHRAGQVIQSSGSLGEACAAAIDEHGFREGLAQLADRLRPQGAKGGLAHLIPDPRRGSACKRMLLYLRWMSRPADGIDLGLWPVDPAQLLIPVDTHVQRIAKNLGLTTRSDASWATSESITKKLRALCPEDPVRYDVALCHLGISRRCPSAMDPERCEVCVVQPICQHWQ